MAEALVKFARIVAAIAFVGANVLAVWHMLMGPFPVAADFAGLAAFMGMWLYISGLAERPPNG